MQKLEGLCPFNLIFNFELNGDLAYWQLK